MGKFVLKVEGMSCSHCAAAVKNALDGLGIKEAVIDLDAGLVSFEADFKITPLDKIEDSIREEGFNPLGLAV